MSRLSLYLLGPPRIERDGITVRADTRKAIALLAYLAVTGKAQRRDALIDLLWPDSDSTHAHAVLRRTLSALRTALDGDWLEADRTIVSLSPSPDLWVDVAQFRAYLAECLTHGHPASAVCPACLPLLAQAVALFRGDLLANFSLTECVDFDDWQMEQTEILRRELAGALERLAQGHAAQGAYEAAIDCARQWLGLDRLNEAAHGELMRLYAWSGQRSAALRQYQDCVAILQEHLGVPPQEALTVLHQSIREGVGPRPPSPRSAQRAATTQVQFSESLEPEQPQPRPIGEQVTLPDAPKAVAVEEKRNVTVLYADASAAFQRLSSPTTEDEVSLVQGFVRSAEDVLRRYGGYIARSVGDSLVAVFGATQTHEGDPELAIRAALQMRDDAARLGLGLTIGVSTGEVYISRSPLQDGQPSGLVGKAVDLAVRLAAATPSGQIMIAGSTYRATRRAFSFTPHVLTVVGMNAPLTTYTVNSLLPQPVKARGIEGLRAELTGRDEEIARLQAALAQVLLGQGQMVSLICEAGVGKSRLIAELKDRALAHSAPPLWLEGRCLELSSVTSYAPFLDILHGYFARDTYEQHLRVSIGSCLQGLVDQGYLAPEGRGEMGALLCRLLSVQPEEEWQERLQGADPEQIRYKTCLMVRDFFLALARRQPVVLVFEDLHWADHLSLDLISLLMEGLSEHALFLVCAHRPGQQYASRRLAAIAAEKCRDSYAELRLRELTQQESKRLLESLLPNEALPPAVQDFILQRAQGNPFFLEETVRSLIDAGIVYREGDYWRAHPETDARVVPDSVQSVILSRVDRLSERAKSVLQTAAVIGRVFPQPILADAVEHSMDLGRALDELEAHALIYQERTIPRVEYSFSHVLTQQAVYQNILRPQRERLHQRVAGAIEALYRDRLGDYYEQLAYHYEESGNLDKAVGYLLEAGEKAKRSFANEAAIAHLSRAMDLLRTFPDSPRRDRKELELQIALGVPLTASKGYATPEAFKVYSRAHELCLQVGDTEYLFPALYGLWRVYVLRDQLQEALQLATQLMDLAQVTQTPALLLESHRALASVYFPLADLMQARAHQEQGLALYDASTYRSHSFIYGHDPALTMLTYSAWTLWLLGYADQALERSLQALTVAQQSSHPFNMAYAYACTAMLHLLRGEVTIVEDKAGAAIALATERAYPYWLAMATVWQGWALAQREQPERGAAEIEQGIDALQAIGVAFMRTLHMALRAEVYGKAGREVEGLFLLDQAFSGVASSGERVFEAEVHRVKGELLLQRGDDEAGAELCFVRALEIARCQQAKGWELRAATSLARLWQKRGKRDEAQALLQGVYGWFTEGFETADLKEARALLDELR